MAGNYSRDKGLRAERGLVTWLQHHGYPQARRLLAGDGRQCGDIDGLGCCIEVKAGAKLRLRQWLKQLKEEQGDLPGFLVWRPPGKPDPGSWDCYWIDEQQGLRRVSVKTMFYERHHGPLS